MKIMKRAIPALVALTVLVSLGTPLLLSRNRKSRNADEEYVYSVRRTAYDKLKVSVIEIDSCEYVVCKTKQGYGGGVGITHKGNCRFCAHRARE